MSTGLTSLSMDKVSEGFDESSHDALGSLIGNKSLKFLRITDTVIENISPVAKQLAINRTLQLINLGNNLIHAHHTAELADALEKNSTLTSLDLSQNPIGSPKPADYYFDHGVNTSDEYDGKGIMALTAALKKNTTLTYLNLFECGLMGEYNFTSRSLTSLDISHNLIENVTGDMPALTYLNVSNNRIGPIGLTNIANNYVGNGRLTKLDISSNNLFYRDDDSGVHALANALKTNSVMKTLILKKNTIGVSPTLELNKTCTLDMRDVIMEDGVKITESEPVRDRLSRQPQLRGRLLLS